MNLLAHEPEFTEARCRHFGECGSCRSQNVPYSRQLKDKEEMVRGLIEKFSLSCGGVLPINHYPEWHYRNKMEFTFSGSESLVCGMYARGGGRGRVFDMKECFIFSPDAALLLPAVVDFARDRGYAAYNKFSHQGFLRNLLVRETKFTGRLMVGIVVSGAQDFDRAGFVRTLRALKFSSRLQSVYLIINDSLSDAVVFEKKELLWGKEFISERLGRYNFNIGIDSFFQVNPRAAADFYEKIAAHAALTGKETVLDLFCGVGGIGLFLAPGAKFVWGVELSPAIVDAARTNARANKINNISFFAAEARKFINTQGSFYKEVDILVLNPPRCGLSPRIIRAVKRLNPKRIIYSSCNPQTLFSNLSDLADAWCVDFIEPFDFFPHTPHLECLTFMSRVRKIPQAARPSENISI